MEFEKYSAMAKEMDILAAVCLALDSIVENGFSDPELARNVLLKDNPPDSIL